MHFHWQNLDDGPIRKHWRNGRCWWGPWSLEWVIPSWRHHWGFALGVNAGDGNDEWTLHVGIGIFAIFAGVRAWRFPIGYWATYHQGKPFFLHEERQFSIALHDGAIWFSPWSNWKGNFGHSSPWWQNGFNFNPADFFLGRRKYTKEVIASGEVLIPMPEGCYKATYEKARCTWKRPWSLFKIQRIDFWFDIPGGIPHEGKGENSWNCGEDGVFGAGSSADNLEEAIGHITGICLRNRKRYGWRRSPREIPVVNINAH